MKKYIKLILNICIMCCIVFNISNVTSYAAVSEMPESRGGTTSGATSGTESDSDSAMGGIINRANDFLHIGLNAGNPLNPGALESGSRLLYNVLLTIGIAVVLIWGLVLAIQFITGSIGEKADVKKNLIVYVIGCIIIFGAFGIWSALLQLLEQTAQ